jgi:signal transduction histidine kinase
VSQVLRNLLNNAKKFSPEKGVIRVSAESLRESILFKVKDNGIGIASENLDKIFEPFYQEEQTMYRNYGGTGLGLTICKGIVESQGGKIWVESEKGKGSTFYFTVPKTPPKETKPIRFGTSHIPPLRK